MAPSPAPDTFYKSLFLFRMQSRVCFNHSVAAFAAMHTNLAAKEIRPNAGTGNELTDRSVAEIVKGQTLL